MSEGSAGRDPGEVRSDRAEDLERRDERHRGYRRAFRLGLAVSVAVHLVILLLLGRQLHVPDLGYDEALPSSRSPEPDLQVTRIQVRERAERATPVPTPPRPIRPEETREQEPEADETPDEAGDEAEEAAGDEAEETVSNVEALTPRQGDPRLWSEFWDEDMARRYLGRGTRADSALRAILGQYMDSLRLSEEQLRQARDWTFTDEEGERWGVSSDGIHLGDVTIPLPVGELLSPTGPRRRQLERELRELREIRRQEAIGEAEETREERIEAMEERAREEREEEASSDTTEGGGGIPR